MSKQTTAKKKISDKTNQSQKRNYFTLPIRLNIGIVGKCLIDLALRTGLNHHFSRLHSLSMVRDDATLFSPHFLAYAQIQRDLWSDFSLHLSFDDQQNST